MSCGATAGRRALDVGNECGKINNGSKQLTDFLVGHDGEHNCLKDVVEILNPEAGDQNCDGDGEAVACTQEHALEDVHNDEEEEGEKGSAFAPKLAISNHPTRVDDHVDYHDDDNLPILLRVV
jgi:hypothetical protein